MMNLENIIQELVSQAFDNSKQFPEIKLTPITNKQLINFKYAPKKIGTRFKLGGKPDWIQRPERVTCKSCKKEMSFYGQLDSINDDIIIGDSGMIYVFYCFDCIETKSIVQSY